jgi:hypothetical protein
VSDAIDAIIRLQAEVAAAEKARGEALAALGEERAGHITDIQCGERRLMKVEALLASSRAEAERLTVERDEARRRHCWEPWLRDALDSAEAEAERMREALRALTQASDRALRRAYEATKGRPTGDKPWDEGASEMARHLDVRLHEELDDSIAGARVLLGEGRHG